MTQYALYTQEGDKLVPLATQEAGSPEDAGRSYVRQKYGNTTPPEEQTFKVVVESAITEVTVRTKATLSFEVTSDRDIRRRASEAKGEKPEEAYDDSNNSSEREKVEA